MTSTFIDTSYLLALVMQDDQLHSQARAWERVVRGRLVTTELVLIEVLDALCKPAMRQVALTLVEKLRADPLVEILPATHELVEAGMALYRARSDKEWGLTDCTSFHVMTSRGISNALSGDSDFAQAGFVALLRLELPDN